MNEQKTPMSSFLQCTQTLISVKNKGSSVVYVRNTTAHSMLMRNTTVPGVTLRTSLVGQEVELRSPKTFIRRKCNMK